MKSGVGATAAVLLAALGACGGTHEARVPDAYPQPARDLSLPDPVPAVPAFAVDLEPGGGAARLARIAAVPGVAVAARVRVAEARVQGPGGSVTATIAGVDPLVFRSVAPPVTRDASFVWSALMAGDAVVSFEAARELGVEGAARLKVAGAALDVGAVADNGVPNLADLILDRRLASETRPGGRVTAVVGLAPGARQDSVGRLLRAMRVGRVRSLAPPAATETPEPAGRVQGGLIGTMNYEILPSGFIEPDPAWVTANIVTSEVPVLGAVTCHRVLIPQMARALDELVRRGLADLIRPGEYRGCYVPRFIGRDPTRALSMHAFGLAFDVNVSSNWEGTSGDMDPRVVEVFERWGFEWGGRWSTPDPMHFELARLISG